MRNPAIIADYRAKSELYVSDDSRLSNPFNLSEGKDVGKAAVGAIKGIEETNPSSRTSCCEGPESRMLYPYRADASLRTTTHPA